MKKIVLLLFLFVLCTALHADDLPIISVLDFYTETGISRSEMRLFISLLSSALFQTNLYTVIDVSERETLLSEIKFSVSDCADESCQLEIGRQLAAEAIIIGRIGRLGSRYVLSIKMLETKTGRAINTADGIYENIDAMVDDVGNLALIISSKYQVKTEEPTLEPTTKPTSEPTPEPTAEPTPEPTEEPELSPIPDKKPEFLSFSAAVMGGVDIPIQGAEEIFKSGIICQVAGDVELHLGFATLGIGLTGGVLEMSDSSNMRYPYRLTVFPTGGNLRLETEFFLPFFFLVEGMGGISFAFLRYSENLPLENPPVIIAPFMYITMGIGYAINDMFRFALCGSYTNISYDSPLSGIGITGRVEVHF
ncbi:MAG: PT domain-containing protein [Spirochaetales bacterium]|nr:PT domain-containing protein [Spirochaetales bacterium]